MKIVIIGAGNVASHFTRAFVKAGHKVTVWNRSEASLAAIKEESSCPCTTDMGAIPKDADVYLISVTDDALESVAAMLHTFIGKCKGVVAHTAGSMPVSLLQKYFRRCGVLYPMQTFTKGKSLEYNQIPFFVEEEDDVMRKLALSVSPSVYQLNGEQRKTLHLAAVFACNFTNHCYSIAEDVLRQIDIPFAALLSLINETTQKVNAMSPVEAQTGPAVREDETVLDQQAHLLDDRPDLQDIYIRMSESIIKYKRKKE